MKVAFFLDKFPTLSETFIRNQITGLIENGHQVVIFCFPNSDSIVWELDDIVKYNIKEYVVDRTVVIPKNKIARFKGAVSLFKSYWAVNKKQLLNAINFFKYGKNALNLTLLYSIKPFLGYQFSIMQSHFGHVAINAIILKKVKFDFFFQVMFHGFDIRLGIEKGGSFYSDLFKNIDRIQAISSYNKENLLRLGLDESKLVFHPVGIDVNKFTKKSEYRITEMVKILSVGRLVWEKGYDVGLKVISKLVNEFNINLLYTIVGDGILMEELKDLCISLNITDNVIFVGAKDSNEIVNYMHDCDIFFLPSKAEALPVVIMEAMACGLPVVATDVGSVTDLVQNDENGLIVPVNDVAAMANRLKYLIDNSGLWETLGTKGRQKIIENYDVNKLNLKLLSI